MMYRIWMVCGLSVLLLFTACSSTNSGSDLDANLPGNQVDLSAEDLELSKSEQLPSAPEVRSSGVRGVVSLSGLTILGEDDAPLLTTEMNVGLMVRIVDPGDDILSARTPETSGTYELAVASELVAVKWELRARVAEDLNGDGEGNDLLQLGIPLTLDPGHVVTVNLAVGLPEAGNHDQLPGIGLVNLPDRGEILLGSVQRADASGLLAVKYAVHYPDQQVVYDQDKDDQIDPELDLRAEDTNSNGWADSFEGSFRVAFDPQALTDGQLDPPLILPGNGQAPLGPENPYLEGVISSVDVEEDSLSLVTETGATVVITLSPFTVLDVVATNGTFSDITLQPEYAESTAYAKVFWTGEAFEATWVTVKLNGIYRF